VRSLWAYRPDDSAAHYLAAACCWAGRAADSAAHCWLLRIIRPRFVSRSIVLLTIILLDVARLLHRPIHVLRRRGRVACVRWGVVTCRAGGSHPHLDWPRLLLRFCPTTLRNRWWLTAILADERLLRSTGAGGRRGRGPRHDTASRNSLRRARLRRPTASRKTLPSGATAGVRAVPCARAILSLINPHGRSEPPAAIWSWTWVDVAVTAPGTL